MRRTGRALLGLALSLTLAPWGSHGQQVETAPRVEEVAPRVFAILQPEARRFNQSNSLFVVRDTGVVVVDTQSSLEATREVIREIRLRTRLPVTHLVLTHWHGDHVQGVAAYRELWPDVQVIGHISVAEDIRGRAQPRVEEDARLYDEAIAAARVRLRDRVSREGEPLSPEQQRTLAGQIDDAVATVASMKAIPRPFAVPDLGYDGELVLGSGPDAVWVKHWRAHTRGDSIVYLPGPGVLATGDVLDDLPYGGHGYPARWLEAVEELARLEVRVVVPGHGSLRAGKEHLETVSGLLRSITGQVAAAVEQGLDLEAARERMNLESYRRRLAGDDPVAGRAWENFIPATIERAWLEARGELPD